MFPFTRLSLCVAGILTMLSLPLAMHLSASASGLSVLDSRAMRELTKGANPAPPGSNCTHELISLKCTDWKPTCSVRGAKDCVPITGAVTCPSCSDTVNQDEICSTDPKKWWTVYNCVTQADDPTGCGVVLKGTVCNWNAILGFCYCDQTAAVPVDPKQDCLRHRVQYDTGCKPK